jgi:hypothetical protein
VSDLAFFVLIGGPSLVLAVASLLLLVKERSMATWLTAIGFCAAAASQMVASFVGLQYTYMLSSNGDVAGATWEYESWSWLTHYLGIAGAWLGTLGLFWYVLRKSSRGIA